MANNFFRTSNPILRGNPFATTDTSQGTMTLNGTIHKTGILFLLLVAGASWTWHIAGTDGMDAAMPWMFGGLIGGLVLALATCFVKTWAPATAPVYAVLEGFALGGISAYLNESYAGIASQAVAATFCVFLVMLALYSTGIVRATPLFVRGVIAATGAVAILYLVNLVMGMFGHSIGIIDSSSPMGIAFSGFVVILAAFNLILDFAAIEAGAEAGAPKYMEWFGAFSLIVTLVWLYIEVLRLLAKTRGRRN